MLIKTASELMQNQKHAEIMAPDKTFQVAQTQLGESLFFSIATNGVLYLTREITDSETGWSKIDLSSPLSANYGGASVTVKAFALSQNPQTMSFDIVLVLTVKDADYLYMSLNLTDSTLPHGIKWTPLPFDADGQDPARVLDIADVYLMNIPSSMTKSTENCFVDVRKSANDPLKLVDRYYINMTTGPHWRLQRLAIDLAAGSISSCVGVGQLKSSSKVFPDPGIYTFGMMNKTLQLVFVPQYNRFNPDDPPPVSRFQVPDGTTAIASSLGADGFTTLFAVASSGLWAFTPNNQGDGAVPVLIASSSNTIVRDMFAGVSEMVAATLGSQTVVWCLNAQRDLFYLSCPSGKEGEPTLWSAPVPMCSKSEGFAFYINNNGVSNVLFAHLNGQNLVRFTQIPSTGLWEQRNVLLPTPDIEKLQEMYTYTSHIQVFQDDGGPATNQNITIRAIGQTSAYINNTYYALDPKTPVRISSGDDGVITVLQETSSLASTCYEVVSEDLTLRMIVDPSMTARQKLSTLDSGAELRSQEIQTPDGGRKLLVPSSVSSTNSDAVVSVLKNLLKVESKLPQDGSPQIVAVKETGTPLEFGINYESENHQFREVFQKPESQLTPSNKATSNLDLDLSTASRFEAGGLTYIKVGLGNLVKWMSDALDTIEDLAIHTVKGFWHLVVKVAGEAWGAILDCTAAVANAVEFIFQKIKVAFEDLVAFVGFLFSWKDIVRTHRVIKRILKLHAQELVSSLGSMKSSALAAFGKVENQINAWAGLEGPETTVGATNAQSSEVNGSTGPQSHWGVYHTKNGVSSADTDAKLPSEITDDVKQILMRLEQTVDDEKETVKSAMRKIKTEVLDPLTSLSAVDIIRRLAGIVAVLVTETGENIVITLIEIAQLLVKAAVDSLDAELHIPIISPIYKKYAGEPLSILDLMCLVGAIPVTVIYKLTTGKAPFPDNAETKSLIDAKDFSTLIAILKGSPKAVNGIKQATNGIKTQNSAEELSVADRVIGSLNTASFFGSLVYSFCGVVKFGLESESKVVNYLTVTSYYIVLLPNIASFLDPNVLNDWSNFNIAWTFLSASKAMIDNLTALRKVKLWEESASSLVESYIDVFWFIPIVGTFVDVTQAGTVKTSDIEGFVGACVGNLSGICTPLTMKAMFPEIAPFAVVAVCAAGILSGGANLLAGMAIFGGN